MAVDGGSWFQDASYPHNAADSASSFIGYEIADPAGFLCVKKLCSYTDVSLSRLTTTNAAPGWVAKTLWGCSPVCDLNDPWTFVVDTIQPHYVIDGTHPLPFQTGEVVQKIGTTTAWTGWVVSSACVDAGWNNSYVYPCQVGAELMKSDQGDSGAPLLTDVHGQDSTVTIGGVVIGKLNRVNNSTVFTPWNLIAQQYPTLRPF